MTLSAFVFWMVNVSLAPLLLGVINKTKAMFAGRRGAPWLQAYYDLWKLMHKAAVYSRTTTWIFWAGPTIGLASMAAATVLLPFDGSQSLRGFPGDMFVFGYLLALTRFFMVLAALDTGSSFEGMGASREVWLSALAEPAFFLSLVGFAIITKQSSLSGSLSSLAGSGWQHSGPALIMLVVALFIILLAENSRIPVDDPATHLELTMIHEVMVLDHSGPDFGFNLYTSALKIWAMGALISNVVVPVRFGNVWADGILLMTGILALGVVVGCVESVMARLRLLRIPQLIVAAGALAVLSLILILR